MSLIDEALTEHTETLLAKATQAKEEYEQTRLTLASQHEVVTTETAQLEQLKAENQATLEQITTAKAELETQSGQLRTMAEAVAKADADNKATAEALIIREQILAENETKLNEDRNKLDGLQADLAVAPVPVNTDAVRDEINKDQQELKSYALELASREDALKADQASLAAREEAIAQQEALIATTAKQLEDKREALKTVEASLLATTQPKPKAKKET